MVKRRDKWDITKEENLDKAKESLEKGKKTVKESILIEAESIPPKKAKNTEKKKKGSPTLQSISKRTQKDSPFIIVSYKNKKGQDISKTYTCQYIAIHQNTVTTLEGEGKTTRKDIVDLSIDAKVIGID